MVVTEQVPGPLRRAVESLSDEFAGVFSVDTVRDCVLDSFDRLAREATVMTFLPVLAERFARERLRASALATGAVARSAPVVLFVCTHNAGRSQLAAGLLDRAARGRVTIAWAGTSPASEVEPAVVQALAEVGVDATEAFPKPLTEEVVRAADVVVTMGCGDACPLLPGRRYLDWDLADPMGQDLDTVRAIRDDVEARVETLLADILPATATEVRS